MFRRFSNSWELVKASWQVLQSDKELVVFPLLSGLASLVVMITFLVPSILAGIFDSVANEGGFPVAGYVIGFLFYVVMYTVTFFFNVALIGSALKRLNGGDPTVSDGLQLATSKLGAIIQYAVISATVGVVLRFLRERGGIVGAIVSALGGLAWQIATFLVVPVLVVEGVSPIDAIKRSTRLLKDTWGEQIIGNFSIGLVFGLITIAAVIVVGVPLFLIAAATESVFVIVAAVAIIVLLIVAISLIGSALNGIYVAALYQYATAGVTNPAFDQKLIENAFQPK